MAEDDPGSPSSAPPTLAALELTYSCNHECVFCSNVWKADATYPIRPPLTGDQWRSVASRLCKTGVSSFCVTGGEPTLHPDFKGVLTHLLTSLDTFDYHRLYPVPVDVSVLTNGDTDGLRDDEVASLLASKRRGSHTVSVAVHGGHEAHAMATRGGDLERTLRTIRFLSDRGVTVLANVVIGGEQAERNALEAARVALEAGASDIVVMRTIGVGREERGAREDAQRHTEGATRASVRRSIAAIAKMVAARREKTGKGTGYVTLACSTPRCVVPDVEGLVVPRGCACGSGTICIDPAGFVRPCTTSPVVAGNVLCCDVDHLAIGAGNRDCLESIMHSGAMKAFVEGSKDNSKRPEMCRSCPHSRGCSAGCPSSHVDCGGGVLCDPLVVHDH